MDLTEFHAKLRIDLKDTGAVWSAAELTRSIERAVDDLSRHIPLEKVHEETLDFTVTDESFTTPVVYAADAFISVSTLVGKADGDTVTPTDYTPDVPRRLSVTLTDIDSSVTALTMIVKGVDQDGNYIEESWYRKDLVHTVSTQGDLYFKMITEVEINHIAGNGTGDNFNVGNGNAYDSFIFLANKLIKPESEVVTSSPAGTTYARGTDYIIDYANGAIKFINGGGMAENTTYLISYTKSRLGINIGSILPIATRVQGVQYPVDIVPQQFVAYGIRGDFLYVGSQLPGKSQEQMTDGKHIAIYYEMNHMPPSYHSHGSYPRYLDQVVAIGAAAYALFIETLQYEQQAVTDMGSARDSLGSCAAIHTLADTALNTVTDYINEAHEVIGKMDTYLVDTVGSGTDCAKDVLANVTDDLLKLRTAISDALDAANAYLDDVDVTDLGKVTVGAEGLLEAGDDTIDQLNDGKNVPELYAEYSRARSQIGITRTQAALGFVQEAAQRIANIRTYIDESAGWVAIANGFATDAGYRVTMGQTIVGQAQAYISQIDRYLSEATQYSESAANCLLLSDRFRAEAQIRLAEFHDILKSKAEYRKRVSSIPVKQPA